MPIINMGRPKSADSGAGKVSEILKTTDNLDYITVPKTSFVGTISIGDIVAYVDGDPTRVTRRNESSVVGGTALSTSSIKDTNTYKDIISDISNHTISDNYVAISAYTQASNNTVLVRPITINPNNGMVATLSFTKGSITTLDSGCKLLDIKYNNMSDSTYLFGSILVASIKGIVLISFNQNKTTGAVTLTGETVITIREYVDLDVSGKISYDSAIPDIGSILYEDKNNDNTLLYLHGFTQNQDSTISTTSNRSLIHTGETTFKLSYPTTNMPGSVMASATIVPKDNSSPYIQGFLQDTNTGLVILGGSPLSITNNPSIGADFDYISNTTYGTNSNGLVIYVDTEDTVTSLKSLSITQDRATGTIILGTDTTTLLSGNIEPIGVKLRFIGKTTNAVASYTENLSTSYRDKIIHINVGSTVSVKSSYTVGEYNTSPVNNLIHIARDTVGEDVVVSNMILADNRYSVNLYEFTLVNNEVNIGTVNNVFSSDTITTYPSSYSLSLYDNIAGKKAGVVLFENGSTTKNCSLNANGFIILSNEIYLFQGIKNISTIGIYIGDSGTDAKIQTQGIYTKSGLTIDGRYYANNYTLTEMEYNTDYPYIGRAITASQLYMNMSEMVY